MTEQSRSIDLSVEVTGTVEEVWDAIATGPGISSWFVPTSVDEHVGGTVVTDFGDLGVDDSGRVAVWDPPHRVVFSADLNGHPLAFEWLVEAKDGDTCIVRLVNTGFGPPGSDWEGDYDGMSAGWRIFMANLQLHLQLFRGQRAETVVPVAIVPGPNERAWAALCDAFGVAADLKEGDPFSPARIPLVGRVDSVTKGEHVSKYSIVLDDGRGTGFLAAEGAEQVAVSAYLYLYGADAKELGESAKELMRSQFPRPAKSG